MYTTHINKRHKQQPYKPWIAAFVIWALAFALPPAHATIPTTERAWLTLFYLDTQGDYWYDNNGWKTDGAFSAIGTECSWFGVTCDAAGNHVTSMDFNDDGLSGSLPSSLAALTNLVYFDVSSNELFGSIPSLTGLTQLQDFYIYNNQFSGSIPSLVGLAHLEQLDVGNNQLNSSLFTSQIGEVTSLQYFWAYNNQLNGSIPDISGLNNLRIFNVSNNQLTGSLSFDMSGLNNLRQFMVDHNQLAGLLPYPPSSLIPGASALCPNAFWIYRMDPANYPIYTSLYSAWSIATGWTPWWGPAGGGCDEIFSD